MKTTCLGIFYSAALSCLISLEASAENVIKAPDSANGPKSADQAMLVIGAGKDKATIGGNTSESDLVNIFGSKNVRHKKISLGEGFYAEGTVLFQNDPSRKVEFIWKDKKNGVTPSKITISGNKSLWTLNSGIGLGTTLAELEKLNGGPYVLLGFDWDYEGTVVDWKNGKLHNFEGGDLRVVIRLKPSNTGPQFQKDRDQVAGENKFPSDTPAMQRLNPKVYEIVLLFGEQE